MTVKRFLIFGVMLLILAGSAAENIRLFLPEKIYAVPGVEMNVYFNNIVTVINPANYVFDVDCPKGRNDLKRWRFTPVPEDAGTYKWSIRIYNMEGEVARGETQLIVLPADAGKGKNLSLMMIGASQTQNGYYPDRVVELMSRPGNPAFRTVGSRGARQGKHEGYGGWRWGCFFTRKGGKMMDGQDPRRPVGYRSPFLFPGKNGALEFDLQRYFDKYNGGNIPDVVSFQLGINDFFLADDSSIARMTEESLKNMEKLIGEFRKLKKVPRIMIFQHIPGAGQDGFGRNYRCGRTSWQYRKNLDHYNRALLKKGKEMKLTVVPVYINIDTEKNYPTVEEPVNIGNSRTVIRQDNGVHPAPAGYYQMGDTLYCWLKALLAEK